MTGAVPVLWRSSFVSATSPPLTTTVGEPVAVVKTTFLITTFPESTEIAGDWPTMVTVVPPFTIVPLTTSVTPVGGLAMRSE